MQAYKIFAIASMMFAGLTSVLAKYGLKNVSGDAGLAVRTSLIFVLIWINVYAFNHAKEFSKLTKQDVLFLCLSGLTTTLSWIFYYKAIKIGNVSEVALIDKASIVITLLLSFLFLNEAITWKVGIGCMMILGGLWVIAN